MAFTNEDNTAQSPEAASDQAPLPIDGPGEAPHVVDREDLGQGQSTTAELHQFAAQLSRQHLNVQVKGRGGRPALLDRLYRQHELLQQAYQLFQRSSQVELTQSRAAEWLLDNFYILEQTVRQIEEDMPPGFYRQLPQLTSGVSSALPRIFAVAQGMIDYWDGRLDAERIARFAHAYQTEIHLTMGELWALPVALRLAYLEELTAAVCKITGVDGNLDPLCDSILLARLDAEAIVAIVIPNLRTLSTIDWADLFEEISIVEQILVSDPVDIYTHMDFETRNQYRSEIERLARRTGHAEDAIAAVVVALAQDAYEERPSELRSVSYKAHVGYYLLEQSRDLLYARLKYRPSLLARLRSGILRYPLPFYLGSIGLLTLGMMAVLLATINGVHLGYQVLVAILVLNPLVTVAMNLVDWAVTHLLPPRVLPKMDFQSGIPDELFSIVVVPTLLSEPAEIAGLAGQMERHFLANSDPNLRFALLTDFADAPQRELPTDAALLSAAASAIEELNTRYASQIGYRPFYLLHRERRWNDSEGCWMGWERKRGKLSDFNRLVLGSDSTSYLCQIGELDRLAEVKYVITLDADTILARDTAQRLVATLSHPLNQARVDPVTGRVIGGYTVLQPRVEIAPTGSPFSKFAQLFIGEMGLDLYTRAVSDVYQDLFGEGIYAGKGVYDLEAFERSLENRIPENRLLSHDLFEGVQGRAGLVTDIPFYEEFPTHYLTFTQRLHRWVRGDWQLLPWLLPQVPCADGAFVPNDLSGLSRWKILDNLRRSLFLPSLLLLWTVAWLGWLPGSAALWMLFGLAALFVPTLRTLLTQFLRTTADDDNHQWRQAIGQSLQRQALILILLPHRAFIVVDAIVRTLWRLFATRRHLLEWTAAAAAGRSVARHKGAGFVWRQMISAPLGVLVVGWLIAWANPLALLTAAPLLLLWLISPQIAYWISQPQPVVQEGLTDEQRQDLRRVARRTWLFFERFVGPDDHWLPPDHFQESPRGLVAHRTSPTNIGLLLTSSLAAHDLGYISTVDLIARLQNTFASLDRLAHYRGHLLNWYDTSNLEPLSPRYVSTVDSGNLAACLIVLRQALPDLIEQPLHSLQRWRGLLDTLEVFQAEIAVARRGVDSTSDPLAATAASMQAFHEQLLALIANPKEWPAQLGHLKDDWSTFETKVADAIAQLDQPLEMDTLRALRIWTERMRYHFNSAWRDQEVLMPWLDLHAAPPATMVRVEGWRELLAAFPGASEGEASLSLRQVVAVCDEASYRLDAMVSRLAVDDNERRQWCAGFEQRLEQARQTAQLTLDDALSLAARAEEKVNAMDFRFLFDEERQLFHLGYNVASESLDANYYDLMASEARIASLIAIAKGDVPSSHWLHLGRPLTRVAHRVALLSWSATMFEYLMPPLFMHSNPRTLLSESAHAAVHRQIDYAAQKNVPWGISESGYFQFDAAQNYQYRAFGVPGLGFKRGLSEDLVIAPYACLMALPIAAGAVMENLQKLRALGMEGLYGFYEALDFTDSRLPMGREHAIVRSFMAHHHGMALLGLVNYLAESPMVRRFHQDPRIQTVELLLNEGVPASAPTQNPTDASIPDIRPAQPQVSVEPWPVPVNTPIPQVHYLSNGRYGVMITNAGGGYSNWQQSTLTRWRMDTTLDNWGQWLYIRDEESGELWSATPQPIPSHAENCEVFFHPHMAEFRSHVHEISLNLKVMVGLDDDVEIRELTLTNNSDRPRHLQMTSYGEVVLGNRQADLRHQAFNKLFIQSEYIADPGMLLFRRRQRSAHEAPLFMAHMIVDEGAAGATGIRYETDRRRFLGRHGSYVQPAALQPGGELTNTVGSTLDPVMAIGKWVTIEPKGTLRAAFVTLAGDSRRQLIEVAEHYRSWSTISHAFEHVRTRLELDMSQMQFTRDDLRENSELLSALIYPHAAMRAVPEILARNRRGQSSLWPYAISGDYPILLVHLGGVEALALARRLLRAHQYWRRQGLQIDLVFLNEHDTGYAQELHEGLMRLLVQLGSEGWINQRGGIFVLRAEGLGSEERTLLETSARLILDGAHGDLAKQLARRFQQPTPLPRLATTRTPDALEVTAPPATEAARLFENGYGGFSADGREYQIDWRPGRPVPAPWSNVIANANFGFLVTEAGGGYTWAENSGENRLTPWSNDPVLDAPGEIVYLRDEESGAVWSATPLPAGAGEAPPAAGGNDPGIRVRHGAGYSVFEQCSHGLAQSLTLFTTVADPVKILHVKMANKTDRPRRLTLTYYVEWVLGPSREAMQTYVVPEFDAAHQALLARNAYNIEFAERIAFVSASQDAHGITADRGEFLGRLGNYVRPPALERIGLSGRVEPGLDPCAAFQIHVDLPAGATETVHFLIGQGENRDHALELIGRYRNAAAVEEAWRDWTDFWERVLGAVQIDTPDLAMNLMGNRWLLYQALSCRIWGRSAFYQSSGAYGFRDQLQDVLAVLHVLPDEARQQICRSARHQFVEGDVLHWWHPPSGRGVRTRITDDLLWLPYVTAGYVKSTGDESVLWVEEPFLEGEPLLPNEEERYGHYSHTEERYTILEHCRRALDKGWSRRSARGLPLIGGGDWNDGMNRVGIDGKGESIWLGWFFYRCLNDFTDLCRRIGRPDDAERYGSWAAELQTALAAHAWDGNWYLRATYDDGTPLGSHQNEECQIDAIAQSWSVISVGGNPERAEKAMAAVAERLIRPEDRLSLLFTPPFDRTDKDPGYIKGYLPGIRENGGQYTHAAIWTAWAYAVLGQGDRSAELFNFINPVNRSQSQEAADHYSVEPYVVVADIYGAPPHVGRGGWTWYTGSSGWLYRLCLEAILGLQRHGDHLRIAPCIPRDWPGYELHYCLDKTRYHIRVENQAGVNRGVVKVVVDGKAIDGDIPLHDDGLDHKVVVTLGQAAPV